ncbi:MAG: diphosphate--fructose-6-phosphate 1-phosphotransferase, partial [Spirochaetota bacterium]
MSNAIIGQSGGPTSVINSSLCGVIQAVSHSKSIGKVLGMRYGIEGFLRDEVIDLSGEEQQVIEGLKQTPSSALGSCRYKLKDEDFPPLLEKLKRYAVGYVFLIGGNDTMDTIHRLEAYCRQKNYPLCGVGIPKTVDNDLFGTDHTPGFPSAARYIAVSVQQAGQLARDMKRVDQFAVFQSIGRDAGWLAASSALARRRDDDAPHLIYLPERRITPTKVLAEVKECIDSFGWCYIVCGEGVLWEDGTPVSAARVKDSFSNIEFGAMGGGSAALNLHTLIRENMKLRGEFQITESLPMCAIDRAAQVDLDEAYRCGVKAVEFAEKGTGGVMVS